MRKRNLPGAEGKKVVQLSVEAKDGNIGSRRRQSFVLHSLIGSVPTDESIQIHSKTDPCVENNLSTMLPGKYHELQNGGVFLPQMLPGDDLQ
jgi:hypothetical protein